MNEEKKYGMTIEAMEENMQICSKEQKKELLLGMLSTSIPLAQPEYIHQVLNRIEWMISNYFEAKD